MSMFRGLDCPRWISKNNLVVSVVSKTDIKMSALNLSRLALTLHDLSVIG